MLPPVAGYCGWYDASDTASITDAGDGATSQWNDKSGNGLHLTQGSSGKRPKTGVRTSSSGLNVINFDGSDDMLGSITFAPFNNATAYTVFAVAQADALSEYWRLWEISGGEADAWDDAGDAGTCYLDLDHSIHFLRAPDNVWHTGFGVNSPHIVTVRRTGTTFAIWQDGVAGTTSTVGDATAVTPTAYLRVGNDYGSAQPWHGWIGELIFYSRSLTNPEREAVEAYLKNKWMPTPLVGERPADGRAVDYRILLYDIVSEELKDEIPLLPFSYSHILNSPGAFSGTIPMDHPKATRANLKVGATAVYIVREGIIVWSGMLDAVKPDWKSRKLTLVGNGWLAALNRRHLHSRNGMLFSSAAGVFTYRPSADGEEAACLGYPDGTDLYKNVDETTIDTNDFVYGYLTMGSYRARFPVQAATFSGVSISSVRITALVSSITGQCSVSPWMKWNDIDYYVNSFTRAPDTGIAIVSTTWRTNPQTWWGWTADDVSKFNGQSMAGVRWSQPWEINDTLVWQMWMDITWEAIPSGAIWWDNIDQFEIVRDMVRHTQAEPGGDLHIELGTEHSGIARTQHDWGWENKEIGGLISTLSKAENGFDYAIESEFVQGTEDSLSLIPNGSWDFDTPGNTEGWWGYYTTCVQSTDYAYSGAGSIKGTGAGVLIGPVDSGVTAVVTGETMYEFEAQFYVNSSDKYGGYSIIWYNSSKTEIASRPSNPLVALSAGSWTRITFQHESPPSAAYVAVIALFRGPNGENFDSVAGNEPFYLDRVRVSTVTQVPDGNAAKPVNTLKLYYPKRGNRLSEVRFDRNNLLDYASTVDGSKIANRVDVTGAGEGTEMVIGTRSAPTEWIETPLWEKVIAAKYVDQQATLDATAQQAVNLMKLAQDVPSFTVRPDANVAPVGSFGPGDEVNVVLKEGYIDIDKVLRVQRVDISVNENLDENQKVTFADVVDTGEPAGEAF